MLKFRPHHFLCALGFKGRGYSGPFVENFQKIAEKLHGPQGDQTPIQVLRQTDSICAPCPHRREAQCQKEESIQAIDEAHQNILGLKEGEVLTWGEAKKRLAQSMSMDDFHWACGSCEWKHLGFCEQELAKLKH